MNPTRDLKRVMWLLAAALCLVGAVSVRAADDAANLQNAVKLFQDGKYLAAQELLAKINRDALNEGQRTTRDEYIEKVQLALNQVEKANRDLEKGEAALRSGDLDAAERLLQSVLDNQYSPEDLRKAATNDLKTVAARRPAAAKPADSGAAQPQPAAAPAPPPPGDDRTARAKSLTTDGFGAIDESRYDDARHLFEQALELVPGYPEAIEGLERVAQHQQVEEGPTSLIERMRTQDFIAWQRTVASYRDTERQVREHVMGKGFEQARQALLLAEQVVEAGRQYADPLSKYETLRGELDALRRYVADEERIYNQEEVQRVRQDAERERETRIRQIREERQRQIDALMKEARQHRKDHEYRRAADVLRQVVAIDPSNDDARFLLDEMDEAASYQSQRRARAARDRGTQSILSQVEEDKVPETDSVVYPKNWLDLISRPTRGGAGRANDKDISMRDKLDKSIRIHFDGEPLEQVFAALQDSQDVNISVLWNDLAKAGVDPKTPLTLKFPKEVAFKTAMDQVLDRLGGETKLGYRVGDGMITVATRQKLDTETYTEYYPVHDLLMEVPDFDDAPKLDLRNSVGPSGQQLEFASRKPRHGATWEGDDDDENRQRQGDRARRVDELVAVIRKTVAPESWREDGGTVGNINEFNGQLVVTQTSAAQEEIADLLGKLRAQAAVQVAVEARFLTVQSNYLEEMGMDLDVILNSGNAGYDFVNGGGGTTLLDPTYGNRVLLPREFSRLGFTPAVPGVGQALTQNAGLPQGLAAVPQPYVQSGFVPQSGNSFIGGKRSSPIPILNNILPLTDPATINSDLPGSFAGNPTQAPAFNVFGSFLDNIQVDFLLRATQADSRTTLLTAPRLTLFNGQRAWVAVANQQSFVSTLQPVVAAGAAAQMPQIGNISTGASLDVQAIVSADRRYVCMTLRPSVGRLLALQTFAFTIGGQAGSGFVQLPSISLQVIRTTVCVPDGGTLLLGGQKIAGEFEVEAGVPILSKIPVLKRAYSSRTLVKDEQVLLILVKPKILIQKETEEEALSPFAARG